MATKYPTVPKRLLEGIDRYASPRAQIAKQGAEWLPTTASEMLRRIAGLSAGLAKLGVAAGDRVAVFAPNCPEWHVADFATLGLGAVVVPIYFRESPERMTYILGHSEAKVIFIAGEEQAKRWNEMAPRPPGVEKAIMAGAGTKLASAKLESRSGESFSYEELHRRRGRRGDRSVPEADRRHGFGWPGVDHLHFGHDRRAQGSDALACELHFE